MKRGNGLLDLTGQRFGRLRALKPSEKRMANGNICWKCECICGNIVVVDGYLLRTGKTKSCGCLRAENSAKAARNNPKFNANMGNIDNLKTCEGVYKTSITKGKKNQSGVIGVSYDKQQDLWFSRLMVNGHYVLLKGFKEFDEVVIARKTAEKKYLYHTVKAEASA